MVHQDVERLRAARWASGGGADQQLSLVTLHTMRGGDAGTKRARHTAVEAGTDYLKNMQFGGRGNFLPAEAPVIFRRIMNMPLLRDVPGEKEPLTIEKVRYSTSVQLPLFRVRVAIH